jgi:hypothetical protein
MSYRVTNQKDSKERIGPLIDKMGSTVTCLNCEREFYFVGKTGFDLAAPAPRTPLAIVILIYRALTKIIFWPTMLANHFF